jgi:valyl-tRNA synthetase
MPFITEEIYASLARASAGFDANGGIAAVMSAAGGKESIMTEDWPEYDAAFAAGAESDETSYVIEVIRSIRNVRSEMSVPPSRKAGCVFVPGDRESARALDENRAYIERLASIKSFEIKDGKEGISPSDVSAIAGGTEIFMPLGDLIDIAGERARLEKELSAISGEIERASGRLGNPGFTEKAPKRIVDEERVKLTALEGTRSIIIENIERLSNM